VQLAKEDDTRVFRVLLIWGEENKALELVRDTIASLSPKTFEMNLEFSQAFSAPVYDGECFLRRINIFRLKHVCTVDMYVYVRVRDCTYWIADAIAIRLALDAEIPHSIVDTLHELAVSHRKKAVRVVSMLSHSYVYFALQAMVHDLYCRKVVHATDTSRRPVRGRRPRTRCCSCKRSSASTSR
jgi:hypothetical protein